MKKYILLPTALLLSGCFGNGLDFSTPYKNTPVEWSAYQSDIIQQEDAKILENWWQKLNDPTLNQLIAVAMEASPDRRIAEGRILEARGIRRTTASSLFPSLDATGRAGRQDDGLNTDNFYEVGFDASYEIDVFGRNRKATDAANKNVERLEAEYHNVTLTLVAEISRDYIDYRRFQKQQRIAQKNLEIQEKTLELVRKQKEFGEAPQLDVERSENLVNTTRASIPEFIRQAEGARYRLSVLTGKLPADLKNIIDTEGDIPDMDIQPVLMAPANVIALRPDIRATIANLEAATSLKEAAIADVLPQFTLSGFFGIAENALTNTTSIWSAAISAAVNLIDFGRLRGQIEAAEGLELQAFELYRKTLLESVSEVETALTDYARNQEQSVYLQKAYDNADKALELSQLLYKEGEVSFINVLEAQRTLNESDAALVNAQAAQTQSLVRLYKSLGVY
ncbi:MAG: efflux transporter outer membrane subunit [Pseudomonadota bacterium]